MGGARFSPDLRWRPIKQEEKRARLNIWCCLNGNAGQVGRDYLGGDEEMCLVKTLFRGLEMAADSRVEGRKSSLFVVVSVRSSDVN